MGSQVLKTFGGLRLGINVLLAVVLGQARARLLVTDVSMPHVYLQIIWVHCRLLISCFLALYDCLPVALSLLITSLYRKILRKLVHSRLVQRERSVSFNEFKLLCISLIKREGLILVKALQLHEDAATIILSEACLN